MVLLSWLKKKGYLIRKGKNFSGDFKFRLRLKNIII
jgi:hypothetical protein